MFCQNIRFFLRHDISQQASAHSSDHADKHQQKQLVIPGIPGCINADHRKNSETDRIRNIHQQIVKLSDTPVQQISPDIKKRKQSQ